jgi:hypothetical protein
MFILNEGVDKISEFLKFSACKWNIQPEMENPFTPYRIKNAYIKFTISFNPKNAFRQKDDRHICIKTS